MAHLQKQDYKLCQDLLRKAEQFTEHNERMRAITYNNYACLFRKTNKLRNALNYLEQALDLEYKCLNTTDDTVEQSLVISNPCEIHLNICAILSQMDKHETALHHAMKALILIQDELGERMDLELEGKKMEEKGISQSSEDRFSVMIIALHNIAVEYEYLKLVSFLQSIICIYFVQYSASLSSYKKAADFANQVLGGDHPMTIKMEKVLEEATQKVADTLER